VERMHSTARHAVATDAMTTSLLLGGQSAAAEDPLIWPTFVPYQARWKPVRYGTTRHLRSQHLIMAA
jgi:hypothetical protein